MVAETRVLDQYGRTFALDRSQAGAVEQVRARFQRQLGHLQARYDAAQTGSAALDAHWGNADHLAPQAAASFAVRRRLRSRSRYEVIENNPYLKGIFLTLVNDFVGSGAKLQITDTRIPKKKRREIEKTYERWAKKIKYRQILWRLRMAKGVDGEGFKLAYTDRRLRTGVKLNFKIIESDQVTTEAGIGIADVRKYLEEQEVDGLELDEHQNPRRYYVLDRHPGSTLGPVSVKGKWIPARWVSHWFRRDRGWFRGIPELTPSLPLCALLRRYTLAVVKAAETAADFAAVLSTEGPPGTAAWSDGSGNMLTDDPFDSFPITQGAFVTLPWGYKMEQLRAEHPTLTYDVFVGALLREIARPLLVPFNYASGTSKDSNMASAIVDAHVYKEGVRCERLHCQEEVLTPDFELWWEEATLVPGYLPIESRALRMEAPDHIWRWDRVGLDHTDPAKVANALKIAHDKGFITDRDVQEAWYNRDVEDWQEDLREQQEFRDGMGLASSSSQPADHEENDEDEDE